MTEGTWSAIHAEIVARDLENSLRELPSATKLAIRSDEGGDGVRVRGSGPTIRGIIAFLQVVAHLHGGEPRFPAIRMVSKEEEKEMQEEERKGSSDVGSSCADSSKLDDLSIQINDQIDSDNKTP